MIPRRYSNEEACLWADATTLAVGLLPARVPKLLEQNSAKQLPTAGRRPRSGVDGFKPGVVLRGVNRAELRFYSARLLN